MQRPEAIHPFAYQMVKRITSGVGWILGSISGISAVRPSASASSQYAIEDLIDICELTVDVEGSGDLIGPK